jgi:oxygen-independent coproporphyrinogen-3 oxidase
MENFMILGLRLLEGVSRTRFFEQYGVRIEDVFGTVVADLVGKGLLEEKGDRIALTESGLLFGNDVFAAFLGSVEENG